MEPKEFFEYVPKVTLTPRQKDAAILLAQGYSNLDIALKLGVKIRTAENHVRRAYEKMADLFPVSNRHPRVSLARIVIKAGLA